MDSKKSIFYNDLGQTVLEISLVIGVLILVIICVFPNLQNSIVKIFNTTTTVLSTGDITPVNVYFPNTHQFQDASSWIIVKGSFSIQDGVISNSSTGENWAFANNFTGTDYSVDIRNAQLQSGKGYGVWFRADPNDGRANGYTFQYDPGYLNDEYRMCKWVNGFEQSPFIRVSASNFNWNETHHIKVDVVGNTFTAYIDDTAVLTGSDNTYTSGTAGIRTWNGTNLQFQDFTISDSS